MQPIADREFVARGEIRQGDVSVPVTIRGTYSEFEPKPVHCMVVLESDKMPEGFKVFDDSYRLVNLSGVAHDGDKIRISALTEVSTTFSGGRTHWEGDAELFLKGDLDEIDVAGGEIVFSAFIPPSPIALADVNYTKSYDGTIEMTLYDGDRAGIRWNTKLGMAELIDNYAYVDNKIGIDEALIRIRRCEITIRTKGIPKISLGTALEELPEILDESLWLVSFLGRKRIVWYAGEALFIPAKGSGKPFAHAIVHRQRLLGYEGRMGYGRSRHDLLISPKLLRKGLFQDLLTAYETSKYHDVVRKTIPYIMASYEQGYFEAHIGNAYLALETMIAGLGSVEGNESLLAKSDFKRLREKIKQTIEEDIKNPEIVESMKKKLSELNRPPVVEKLLTLLKMHDVAVARLWPAGTNIEQGLQEIFGRRNLYIHQGKLDDIDQSIYDFFRVRGLAELWILKLLGCPDDVIDQHALNNVIQIS